MLKRCLLLLFFFVQIFLTVHAQSAGSIHLSQVNDTVVVCADTLHFTLTVYNISQSQQSGNTELRLPQGMTLHAAQSSGCQYTLPAGPQSVLQIPFAQLAAGDSCRFTFFYSYSCVSTPSNQVDAMISSGALADTATLVFTLVFPEIEFTTQSNNQSFVLPNLSRSFVQTVCNESSVHSGNLKYVFERESDIRWDSIVLFSSSGAVSIPNISLSIDTELLFDSHIWWSLFSSENFPGDSCFTIRTYYRRVCTGSNSSSLMRLSPQCSVICTSYIHETTFDALIPPQSPATLSSFSVASGTGSNSCLAERSLRFVYRNPSNGLSSYPSEYNLKRLKNFQMYINSNWFDPSFTVWVNGVLLTASVFTYNTSTGQLLINFDSFTSGQIPTGLSNYLSSSPQTYNSWLTGDSLVIEVRNLVLQDDSTQGLDFQSCDFSSDFFVMGGNSSKYPKLSYRNLCNVDSSLTVDRGNFSSKFDADGFCQTDTTDIQLGEQVGVNFCYIPQNASRSPWNIMDSQGNRLYTCPTHQTQFVLHLPNDLVLSSSGSPAVAIVQAGNITDTVSFYTTAGELILPIDTFTSPLCIRVYLQLNPDAECPSGGDNLVSFSSELRAVCDTGCANSYITMACASNQLFRHCPGECSDLPMGITSIQLLRETNISSAIRNRAYGCDTLLLTAEGQTYSSYITSSFPSYNPDSVFLELRFPNYTSPSNAGFSFLEGYFVIRDLNNQPLDTIALSISHFRHSLDTGVRTLRFFLPISAVGADSLYTSSRRLSFRGKLVVNPLSGGNVTMLQQIRAQFKLKSTFQNQIREAGCCDPLGTSLMLLRTQGSFTAILVSPESTDFQPPIDYCQYQLLIRVNVSGGLGGVPMIDDFPGEYRPVIAYPDTAVLTLPPHLDISAVSYQAVGGTTWPSIPSVNNTIPLTSIQEQDDAGYTSSFRVILNSTINPIATWTIGLHMPVVSKSASVCGQAQPDIQINAIVYNISATTEYTLAVTPQGPPAGIPANQQPLPLITNLKYTGTAAEISNAWIYPRYITPGISINGIGSLPQVNGYYLADDIAPNTDYFRAISVHFPCSSQRDTLDLIYGYTCFGYDSLLLDSLPPAQNPYARIVGTKRIILKMVDSDLRVSINTGFGGATFSACTTRQLRIRVKNHGEGAVINPQIHLGLSNGLSVGGFNFTNSYPSSFTSLLTDSSLRISVTDLMTKDEQYELTITLMGDSCQQVGSERVRVVSFGLDPCGETDSSNILTIPYYLQLGLCCEDTCLVTGPVISVDSMDRSLCNLLPSNSIYLSLEGYTDAFPYTFLWSNGDTTSNGLFNVTPGSYTCIIQNSFGCTYQDTFAILPSPHQPNPTFTSQTDTCLLYHFTAGDSTGMHVWLYGDGSAPDSGSYQVSHLYPSTGEYQVIHSIWDIYCGWVSDTQTVSIPVQCCLKSSLANPVFIQSPVTTSQLNLTNQSAVVVQNVTLTVDQNLSLTGAHFLMVGPNARIHVSTPSVFSLVESHLYGCQTMWKGIDVDGTMMLKESDLSDAVTGISSTSCSPLELRDNIFYNNWVSVKVTDCPSSYSGILLNNHFAKRAGIPMMPPYSACFPGTGVMINEVDNWQFSKNSFDSISCGVYIRKSSVSLSDLVFSSIHVYTPPPFSLPPQSIIQHGSAVFIVGEPTPTKYAQYTNIVLNCQFRNGDRGIYARGVKTLLLRENIIQGFPLGIYVGKTLHAAILQVAYNSIQKGRLGIHMDNNPHSRIYVGHNVIQCDVPPLTIPQSVSLPIPFPTIPILPVTANAPIIIPANECVRVDEGPVKAISHLIEYNTTRGGQNGIGLYGASKTTQVRDNSIFHLDYQPTTVKQSGIYVLRGDGLSITRNTIRGNTAVFNESPPLIPGFKKRGIALTSTRNYTLRCNSMETIGYGIEVMGECYTADKQIAENSMKNHRNGFVCRRHLNEYGSVGDANFNRVGNDYLVNRNQFNGWFYDAWSGTWGDFNQSTNGWISPAKGRLTWNYTNVNQFDPPRMYYPSSAPVIPNFGGASGPGVFLGNQNLYWIFQDFSLPSASVQQSCSFAPSPPPPPAGNHLQEPSYQDSLIASGDWTPDEFEAVSVYKGERELYARYRKVDTVAQVSPLIETFLDQKEEESIGRFYQLDSLALLLSDTVLTEDSIVRAGLLHAARALSLSVPAENDIVFYEKRMRQLYFQWLEDETFQPDTADMQLLQWLSEQCPVVSGDGVYLARNLRGLLSEQAYSVDDAALCSPFSAYKTDLTGDTIPPPPADDLLSDFSNASLHVFPNPARDEVTVYLPGAPAGESNFGLYDFHGHLLLKFSIFDNQPMTTLSLQSFSSGLYVIRPLSGNTAAVRLLIMHTP